MSGTRSFASARKARAKRTHPFAHLRLGRFIALFAIGVEAFEYVGDHIGDVAEFGDPEAAGSARGRADADPAGLYRRQRIEGDAVLVAGDRGALQRLVGILAGDAERTKVDQGEMCVGAA